MKKNSEKMKGLLAKSATQLNEELASLRKEQFNLRMQAALGQPTKSHLVREARKSIARLKTVMTQQANAK